LDESAEELRARTGNPPLYMYKNSHAMYKREEVISLASE
jgi:hypothetical protein